MRGEEGGFGEASKEGRATTRRRIERRDDDFRSGRETRRGRPEEAPEEARTLARIASAHFTRTTPETTEPASYALASVSTVTSHPRAGPEGAGRSAEGTGDEDEASPPAGGGSGWLAPAASGAGGAEALAGGTPEEIASAAIIRARRKDGPGASRAVMTRRGVVGNNDAGLSNGWMDDDGLTRLLTPF